MTEGTQLWWHVARSGGIVALVLCGLSVIWGLLLSTKILQGRPTPKWLRSLHTYLGGLSVTFTAIHVVALMADSYIQFSLVDILVPFAAAWNPAAVAFGIVSMYLLLAVQLSSMFIKKIPRKWWRGIHASSYLVFWAGLVHGAMAGTDATSPLYILGIGALTLATVFLAGYRALVGRHAARSRASRPVAPTPVV